MDADGDGLVSWDEFKAAFEDDDEEDAKPVSLTASAAQQAANAAMFDSDED